MRMRREEMASIVNDVRTRIGSDVHKNLRNFFNTHGVSIDEFSHMTNIDVNTIRRILGGDTNYSMDTFVKIMVATGNAIEIKSLVPTNKVRRQMGRIPFPRFGGNGPFRGPLANEVEAPRPWEDAHPSNLNEMDSHERVENADLHTKTREELVDMVCEMGLENEIDLRRATRSALINFLTVHSPLREATTQELEMPFDEVVNEPVNEEVNESDDLTRIMNKMARLMEQNPQLKRKIKSVFGV